MSIDSFHYFYVAASSLPNATKESNGLYSNIFHVDSTCPVIPFPVSADLWVTIVDKAVIEEYLRASGVPHAMLLTGWFAENLWKCVSSHCP